MVSQSLKNLHNLVIQALSSHELSLQLIVSQYLPMTYHPSWWLLQAQHFPGGRSCEYIQVCLTSRFQAVAWQAQGTSSIGGDEIKGRLNLTWSGHLRGVANIGDDFLLVSDLDEELHRDFDREVESRVIGVSPIAGEQRNAHNDSEENLRQAGVRDTEGGGRELLRRAIERN